MELKQKRKVVKRFMVRWAKFMPTLRVNGYELTTRNQQDGEYNVFKDRKRVGWIKARQVIVQALDGVYMNWIPYDIEIEVQESTEELPIELFRKIILATMTMTE